MRAERMLSTSYFVFSPLLCLDVLLGLNAGDHEHGQACCSEPRIRHGESGRVDPRHVPGEPQLYHGGAEAGEDPAPGVGPALSPKVRVVRGRRRRGVLLISLWVIYVLLFSVFVNDLSIVVRM